MPKLAETISVDIKNHELQINGEVFPYLLIEEPIVSKTDKRTPTVTITIPATCVERHW